MANVKKALMVFTRLFERIERLGKKLDDTSPELESISSTQLPGDGERFVRTY